mgnify:CR=1 FL=1
MNAEIIPAIMPKDLENISILAGLVKNHAETVQLDLMDGDYVPEKTWPFFYKGDYDFEAIVKEEQSLPFWQDINYELDLMVAKPENRLDDWFGLGASRVIFHYASIADWDKIRSIDPFFRNFTQLGLAVTIHDDIKDVKEILSEGHFDFIQVMAIAHIGYMGEPFEEAALELIDTLHARYPEMIISVDGGVSLDSIAALADAGASRFVSGSGVYGGGVAKENIDNLREAAKISTE